MIVVVLMTASLTAVACAAVTVVVAADGGHGEIGVAAAIAKHVVYWFISVMKPFSMRSRYYHFIT